MFLFCILVLLLFWAWGAGACGTATFLPCLKRLRQSSVRSDACAAGPGYVSL